jgi:hypothetical protein
VEVNSGSSADTRFWYDSLLFPSKAILPAEDSARPISIRTYSVDNSETDLFYYNWSENWRKVIVRANITDPFGGYDIYQVNMTILDPSGNQVFEDEMVRVSNGQWRVSYMHLFEANWSYPMTTALGNYTVIISAGDNNGYYHYLDYGSFEPFVEEEIHIFTIGLVVFFDPTFRVVDDVDDELPEAQVYITWTNGSIDKFPRYTSSDGSIELSQVLAGNYSFTILWKDVVVAQSTIYVDSNGPYTIKTEVYQLTVFVYGNNGLQIHGAYVTVDTQSGVGYGLGTTDETGKTLFRLPSGTYRVLAHYTSDYWLTVVRVNALESVIVQDSMSQNLILTDFPPAIWTTTLFMLLLGLIVSVIGVILLVLFVRRRI